MKTYLRHKPWILGLPIALTFAGAMVAQAASAPSPGCSIAGMASEYGLSLGASAPSAVSSAVQTQIAASLSKDEPGASVVDQQVSAIVSDRLPPVSGHQGVLMLLAGVSPPGIGAPIGFQTGPIRALCVITIYDAQTGAFLVSLKDLASGN